MPFRPSLPRFATAPTRTYLYTVDHHGQLFLSTTKLYNFTSAYKDPAFLDFFNRRIVRNEKMDPESKNFRKLGYEFVSPCGVEMNYIRPKETPIVFQKLSEKGLLWGGTLLHPFDPTSLRADARGYLYHTSPVKVRSNRRSSTRSDLKESADSPYGPYSLLRSSLVLETFQDSLELDDEGAGGSVEWNGQRHRIEKLDSDMIWPAQPWQKDYHDENE